MYRRRSGRLWLFALVALGLSSAPSWAVTVGLVDHFDAGDTQGWASGAINPNPPVGLPGGGPAGVGDGYLLLSASGVHGPGGKLVGFSGPQWAGDYAAAGVTRIGMDVNNLGATDLSLRLLFEGPAPGTTPDVAVLLAAGSGWRHVSFAVAALATGVTQFRLYHGATAGIAEDIAAQLGIDNVAAVPEPQSWLMFTAGLAALVAGGRRRRRRACRGSD